MEQYLEYKDSGIRWIGKIPANWDVVKLKRICRIKRGASPRPIDDPIYFDDNGERYWVRIADVTRSSKYLTECEQKLSSLGIENSVKIEEGDLFVSICASVGKPCISQVKACIHDGFVLLDRLPTPYKNYIYYIFVLELPCHGLGKIGTQLNLNSETIGNIDIPLHDNIKPICAYLDRRTFEIDKLLADLQSQADLLDRYKRELITKTVTKGLDKSAPMKDSGVEWIGKIPKMWEAKRIKFLLNNLNARRKPIEATLRTTDSDVLYDYYGASGVIDQIDEFIFDETTILIGEDGANLVMRNLPLIYIATGRYWVNNHAHILVPKKGNDLRFIAYQMEIVDYHDFITGAAQPKLTQYNLNNVTLAVPPYDEQIIIAEYLDNKIPLIESLIADINKQIEKLKQYRQIVIHDAVTGKIKVKEMQNNGN